MKIRSFLITLTFALIASAFDASAQEQVVIGGVKYTIHDVEKGETLFSLSRKYGVPVDDIKGANEVLVNGLKAGQRIKIPQPQPEVSTKSEEKSVRMHKVLRGETLYSLSKANGLTVEELREANPHIHKGLKAGQNIVIPTKKVVEESAPAQIATPAPQVEQPKVEPQQTDATTGATTPVEQVV